MANTRGWLASNLLRGLSIVVPVLVALHLVRWLVVNAEQMTMAIAVDWFPWDYYVPGTGVLLLLVTVFLLGLLIYPWLEKQLDAFMRRVPLFNLFYVPLRDLMTVFSGGKGEALGQPVMIKMPDTGAEMPGFITRDSAEGLPEGMLPDGHVFVFVQFASQLGGHIMAVPRSACRSINVAPEELLKFALTAGLSAPRASRKKA